MILGLARPGNDVFGTLRLGPVWQSKARCCRARQCKDSNSNYDPAMYGLVASGGVRCGWVWSSKVWTRLTGGE